MDSALLGGPDACSLAAAAWHPPDASGAQRVAGLCSSWLSSELPYRTALGSCCGRARA